MNWWVIVVEICLNSLNKCLSMFVCWWGLNWCGCLWSLNEKWESCGFWWKMNIMMILVRIEVMIPCLLLFWLSFNVYKLMYKFWGRIWVKGDQKQGFWVKIGEFPRGNYQEHQMNWIEFDFVNQSNTFMKNVQEHGFSKNRFLKGKRVGSRMFTVRLIFKNDCGWFTWALTWFYFEKWNSFENDKMRWT